MGSDVVTYSASGKTVYYVIYNTDGLYWADSQWETRDSSHWPQYVHYMVETEQGTYVGVFPATIGAGLYYMVAYEQLSTVPDPSDRPISAGMMDWDGSEEWSGGTHGGSLVETEFSTGTQDVVDNTEITPGLDGEEGISIDSGVEDQGADIEISTGSDSSGVNIGISTGVSDNNVSHISSGVS